MIIGGALLPAEGSKLVGIKSYEQNKLDHNVYMAGE